MRDIKNVLVYGAGLMGANIAFVMTSNPTYHVTAYDVRDVDLAEVLRANTAELVEHGVLSADEVARRIASIDFTTDRDDPAIAGADLVIEAVFEKPELKQEVFAELERRVAPDAILASNSSVISPSVISKDLEHRERFCNMHFWNPAHLIPLVEVVKSDATSDEVAQTAMELLRAVGKHPVLCKKDVPGFIGNRMQAALWREAIYIVEQGIADAATVDEALKYSFALRLPRLGPLENVDMIGTDLTYDIHANVLPYLADNHEPSALLKQLADEGKLGFKTGEGIQSWTPEQVRASREGLNAFLIKMIYDR